MFYIYCYKIVKIMWESLDGKSSVCDGIFHFKKVIKL